MALLLGCFALLVGALASSAAPTATPLSLRPQPLVRHLLVPGDRVEIGYVVDTPGIDSPLGWLYVRNDLERDFERLRMTLTTVTLQRGKQPRLHAVVPGRLLRGQKLLYYAVVQDRSGGRSATFPAGGARGPAVAWILEKPLVVRLGTHRFGRPRAPEAVVARAGPDAVGFQSPPPAGFGPQTFLVSADRSIWLLDGLKQRLLVWRRGRPGAVVRTVPLPFYSPDTDVALGPGGTLYANEWDSERRRLRLYRLTRSGKVIWRSTLASEVTNSNLFVGPDRFLYWTTGMPGSLGAERRWTPAATPAGRPLSLVEQRRRTLWAQQPVGDGLRFLSVQRFPHEMRFALIDGSGHLVRAWRVVSRTAIEPAPTTPALVGGDPVVVLSATAQVGREFKWEYVVLRLAPAGGTQTRFSLRRAVWGDNLLADVRIGPHGKLYQLGSSPTTGIVITRFSLGASR